MKKVIYKINRPYYKARLKRKGWFAICKVGRARWFTDGAAAFNLSYISITGWKKLEEVIFKGKAGKYDQKLRWAGNTPDMRIVLEQLTESSLQDVRLDAHVKKSTPFIGGDLYTRKVIGKELRFNNHYLTWAEGLQFKLGGKEGNVLTIRDKKHLLATVMPIRL